MNLSALIQSQAASKPAKRAIEYRGEVLCYRECWSRIEALAAFLFAAGVRQGDRVGLCLGDHAQHVLLHYALARLGSPIVPIDHRWSAVEKKDVATAFNLSLLIVDPGAVEVEGVPNLPLPETAALGAGLPELPAMPDDGDLPLLISMSSGTTGRPKGAIVTHRQMYERFVTQWVTIGFNTNDRFIVVTPLFFGAGRSFAMSFLAAGATLIVSPPPHKPKELRDTIRASDATATFLVPTVMRRLLQVPGDEPMFPGLRRLLISGEAFYANEVEEFQRRFTRQLIGYYASSEGGGISVLQPDDFDSHGSTVGQAAFGVYVEVVDENDRAVSVDEIGRLRYRGPGVTLQSLGDKGEEQISGESGWFYPGDLASLDDQGYVSLRGREKDVIIRAGVNVYPAEIEHALISHPLIREVAVVGIASDSHGEEIHAFVAGEDYASDEALREFCSERLAPYKVPSAFHHVPALPKAPSGKIDKKQLHARLEKTE